MGKKPNIIDRTLSGYDIIISKIVLHCLLELPFPLGVKRLTDLLKGNRNSFALNNDLHLLDTFSALPGYTRDQLSDIFDLMIGKGYLKVEILKSEDEEYPVIAITEMGKNYLEDEAADTMGILDILMDKDAADVAADDQDLYYKLRLARRQLAEEFDYPAFMVCSDDILKTMCEKKPMEADDLLKIHGVDMAFMKHYSKQFLYVIRQYVTREKGS